jgi:hypothetical protein
MIGGMSKAIVGAVILGWVAGGGNLRAGGQQYEEGKFPPPKPPDVEWVDLLGGKLSDHWTDMNCRLADSFKLGTDDHGVAVLSGSGHPIGLVRSLRAYENFILEVDWRHLTEAPSAAKAGPGGTSGNSGIYVWADPIPPVGNSFTRAIEVQVCNLGNGQWYTSNGDLFPIHGATMIPDPRFGVSGSRSMPIEFRGAGTGQWNHCRITCVDGMIQEEINGAVVTAGFRCSPRKGYLCLESEGGPVEFKNMRLTELGGDPDLKAERVSMMLPPGTRGECLFNGLTLDGWEGQSGGGWSVADRILRCSANGKGSVRHELPDGDYTLILDWQTGKKGAKEDALPFKVTGVEMAEGAGKDAIRAGWNRAEIQFKGTAAGFKVNGRSIEVRSAEGSRRVELIAPGHAIEFCNIMCVGARRD